MGFLRQEYWCGLPFPPPASYFFCCSVAQSCPALCNPWTAACQAFLSFTISPSLVKLMSTESVMPTNHLILCHPLLLLPSVFPSIRVFSIEVHHVAKVLAKASASASVLPMNIQDLFPLVSTGWISLQSNTLLQD